MIATRTSDPSVEPITTAEAKTHLRVDHTDHDTYIDTLIQSAREYIEGVIGRALVQQTWKYYLQDWPAGDEFELPYPPLQSVTSIKYTDSDDDETTWDSDEYEVDTDAEPGRIILAYGETWPSTTLHPKNPIEIEYVAGYAVDTGSSPDDYRANIPEAIKAAVKIHVEMLYDRPNDAYFERVLKDARDMLLAPYKVWRL